MRKQNHREGKFLTEVTQPDSVRADFWIHCWGFQATRKTEPEGSGLLPSLSCPPHPTSMTWHLTLSITPSPWERPPPPVSMVAHSPHPPPASLAASHSPWWCLQSRGSPGWVPHLFSLHHFPWKLPSFSIWVSSSDLARQLYFWVIMDTFHTLIAHVLGPVHTLIH